MTLQRLAICFVFYATSLTALAQFGQPPQLPTAQPVPYPAIAASGQHSVKCLPETVQVIVELQAKGKTIDEALSNLKTIQTNALDKLQKIGIEKERVRFEDFGIDQSQDNARRQMEMMIAQRARVGQRNVATAESVSVKCTLFIESPLTGKTVEEILKESHTLRQKIKEANIVPQPTMTPEEQELAEEMEGMGIGPSAMGGTQQGFGNGPQLVYIANLPTEEYQKALMEAYKQARWQVGFLTTAPEPRIPLGRLVQITGGVNKNIMGDDFMYFSSSDSNYGLIRWVASQNNTASPTRLISTNPDSMEFRVNVQVVFEIKE